MPSNSSDGASIFVIAVMCLLQLTLNGSMHMHVEEGSTCDTRKATFAEGGERVHCLLWYLHESGPDFSKKWVAYHNCSARRKWPSQKKL
jgi:hypothetical protein